MFSLLLVPDGARISRMAAKGNNSAARRWIFHPDDFSLTVPERA
jgi:hypothetical protein